MATQQWYDYPITNGHATDDGVDIGTPDNTPLYFPYEGQVIDTSYHVWGGQVVVHMPDGYDQYFLHMNKIMVQPGEHVSAGQEVGTSGGGIGDLIEHNGQTVPAQSQSWYQGHSSGYHTEFGEFRDTSANGSMSQFDQGFGNKSRQLDPSVLIGELHSRIISLTPSLAAVAPGINIPTPSAALSGAASTAASQAINSAATALGFSSPQNALQRLAVGGAGVILAILGLYVVVQPEAQEAAGVAVKAAGVAAL